MIIGAIDVGSNSVKLLVVATKGRSFKSLAHKSAVTRLGGGIDLAGSLSREAQDRTIAILLQFKRACADLEVERLVAAGTEALRIARNGRAFAERCRKEAGIPLRILSPREEARLAFLGATTGRREPRLAAIDIGGGSTEIMVGKPGKLGIAASVPLGAVRLTERHLKSDPPTLVERLDLLKAAHDGLRRLPAGLRRAAGRDATLLGIGGTCVNVARMVHPNGLPEGREVPLEALEAILQQLAELPLARRKRVPGIDLDRADIIVAGARILVEAMNTLGVDSYTATIHGLRRGLILETAGRRS
jgi:exopolyphosphatase/guanosine-5'-triphosphate,3'-diphosphate pyrophosphatase